MNTKELTKAIQARLGVKPQDGEYGPITALAVFHALGAQAPQVIETERATGLRASVVAIAREYANTYEQGKNSGPKVEEILEACGLRGTRQPYCACFNRRVYDRAGLAKVGPKGGDAAWSPNWLIDPTWTAKDSGRKPRPGDIFGIWFASKKRIAHTGIIVEWGESHVLTMEANTSNRDAQGTEADRDGDGIFLKRRNRSEIHSVRDWIGER